MKLSLHNSLSDNPEPSRYDSCGNEGLIQPEQETGEPYCYTIFPGINSHIDKELGIYLIFESYDLATE